MAESSHADHADPVGCTPHWTIGLNTVIPPQKSGPALAGSTPSGMGTAQAQWARMRSANPPWRPMMVSSPLGQRLWSAAQAVGAAHAAAGKPTQPDAVSDFDFLDVIPRRHDAAGNFMAGDERVMHVAPIVVDDGEVGVADAAIVDRDFYLFVAEFPRRVFKRFESGSR